jgi:hypothetical protein
MLCRSERHCNCNSKTLNQSELNVCCLFGLEKPVTRQVSVAIADLSGFFRSLDFCSTFYQEKVEIKHYKSTLPPCAATAHLLLRTALRSARKY